MEKGTFRTLLAACALTAVTVGCGSGEVAPTPDAGRPDQGCSGLGCGPLDQGRPPPTWWELDAMRDAGPATWDAGPFVDDGSCGVIDAVRYSEVRATETFTLEPGSTTPEGHIQRCAFLVTLVNRPAVESALGQLCPRETIAADSLAHCYVSWSSPLNEEDYAWLCQVRDQLPIEGFACFEYGE
jgi:hypothetical protein